MRRRALAKGGLTVPVISLGAMNFGSSMAGAPVSEAEARTLVDLALDAGCDLLDTADVYGRGESEAMLGRLIAGRRSRFLVATKVLGPMADGDPGGLRPARVAARLDESLRRLRTDRIDLYMPHAPDPATPLDEVLEAMEAATRAGKIRAWGLSNFPPDSVRVAARAGLASGPAFLQVQFSLACRGEERDLARLHSETGVPVLASSPLGGGLLTGKYLGAARPEGRRKNPAGAFPSLDEERLRPELEALARRARAAGSSCARLALAWTLERDWVASAVCGARTPVQWMELLEAGS